MINYGRGKRNETKKTNRQKREEGEEGGERKEDVRCGSVSVRGMCIDLATVATGESRSEALRRSLTPISWLISPDYLKCASRSCHHLFCVTKHVYIRASLEPRCERSRVLYGKRNVWMEVFGSCKPPTMWII